MSQTCNLLELLLVDLRDLEQAGVREMLESAGSHGVLLGAAGTDEASPAALSELTVHAERLDFWFVGEAHEWPFERATSFAGVAPARVLFVSTDDAARSLASAAGLMVSDPDVGVLNPLLP